MSYDNFNDNIDKTMKAMISLKESERFRECYNSLYDYVYTTLSLYGKLIFCGNGGSMSQAQHIATEFTVRFQKERSALSAICLGTDPTYLTACSNDIGFDSVFSRQIHTIANPADLVIGLSTSGRSANIENAFTAAKAKGLRTVLFTGSRIQSNEKNIYSLVDLMVNVPSINTAIIQELHLMIWHSICKSIESVIFNDQLDEKDEDNSDNEIGDYYDPYDPFTEGLDV